MKKNNTKNSKVFFLVLLLIAGATKAFSQNKQKEGNIWYFGTNAGVDFNFTPPKALTNGALSTGEGCATICNKYGNLLMYTDGNRVFDKTHAQMPNGNGLMGHSSSTQSGIIVPNPDSAQIYYIFTTTAYPPYTTNYSVVDTTLNFGLGNVRTKNVFLLNKGGEKLTAVKHSNGKHIWVIAHQSFNDSFSAYLVTGAGVNTTPVISRLGIPQSSLAIGYLKASPDGKKLVSAEYFNKNIELFDFNTTTGVISNAQLLDTGVQFYGAEFSPLGQYLYGVSTTSSPSELYQWDLKAGTLADIKASKTILYTYPTNQAPGSLQLAPDKKIYLSMSGRKFLGVINEPEKKGLACDYVFNGLDISPKSCQFGLPTFIQSFFKLVSVDIEHTIPKCGLLTFDIYNTGDTNLVLTSKWDFGDGTTDTGKFTTKTYAAHGTYTIKNIVEIGGENPKVDTLLTTITTLPKPEAKIVALQNNHCVNENRLVLKDNSTYGTSKKATNMWVFSDTAITFTNKDTITRVYSEPDVYNTGGPFYPHFIRLIVTSTDNCKDSMHIGKNVYPSAVADFSIQGSQCLAENKFMPIQQSYTKFGWLDSIRWDFGDGTLDTNASPIKIYNDTGTFTIRMVAYNSITFCHDTVYKSFTVLPSPMAAFTATDVCYKDSTFIQNNSSINAGTIKYNWSFGDGETDTARQKNYLYADTGTFAIKLIAFSDWMCTDTFQQTVQVKPKPNAAFTFGKHCEKNTVTFTDNSQRYKVPALDNYWVFGDGNTAIANGNTNKMYNNPGNYTVKLVSAGGNGCKDSINKNIYINPIPTVGFTINNPGQCLTDNYFIFAGDTKISTGKIVSREWYINQLPFVSGFSGIKRFTADGVYNIKLVVQTDSFCADSAIQPITVYPQAQLDIAVDDPQQCLSTNLFTFSNNSTISSGSLTYAWGFSSGTQYIATNPPPQHFNVPGLYDVWLMSESDKGCKDTLNERVTVDYNPKADFVTQTICENDSAVFVNTTLGAAGGWMWFFGDGATSQLEKPAHIYNGPGIYQVSLVGVSGNGCSDTVTKDSGVIVQPAPKVYFTADIPGNINGVTAVNFKNFTQFGNNYSWAFGNGNFSRSVHPSENYTDTGYYKVSLSAINDNNCFSEYDTILYIAPDFDLHIPNSFTPNRDPLNPTFKVAGTYYYKTFEMYIYNRWGGLLFYSNNPEKGWDGKKDGEPITDGAYLYYIRMIGTKRDIHTFTGTLYLLR